MNQLQTFKNDLFQVAAKVENNQILFDAEQVARNLGFTTVAKSGNVTIRWNRVKNYLPSNSPKVAKGDFIPESLVYKLAFKASNETAEKFQDWLAIEVIPTIRKTGAYNQQPNYEQLSPELQHLIRMEQEQIEQDQRIGKLEDNLRIDSFQQNVIQKQIKVRVYQVYENISGEGTDIRKLFSSIHKNLHDAFGVPSYRDLRKLDFDEAMAWVKLWRPLF
ncbi:ORF6C domain-containing protein [Bacillus subtilis]